MKNKVYIIDNEEQEQNILTKLENEGCVWHSDSTKPTEYIPSKHFIIGEKFPTAIVKMFNNRIMYETNYEDGNLKQDEEIVYDGRKEDNMSEKYVVSQEFMNTLNLWREKLPSFSMSNNFVGPTAIEELDDVIDGWWNTTELLDIEMNNRLIAIIRWVNGEDVFEVEKPKKWVVRSKVKNQYGDFGYVSISTFNIVHNSFDINQATKFDTKEEAESWANSHQEVIEVEG